MHGPYSHPLQLCFPSSSSVNCWSPRCGFAYPPLEVPRAYAMEAPLWSLDATFLESQPRLAPGHRTYVIQLLGATPPKHRPFSTKIAEWFRSSKMTNCFIRCMVTSNYTGYCACFSCARGTCDLSLDHAPSRFPHLDNKLRSIAAHAKRLRVNL